MGTVHDANSSAVRKRIETHNFDDEEGEEYGASKFGGFGDYMRRKKIKLQNLDAEIRSSSPGCPPIFRGVVAHVNGYTQPSLQDLHRLIVSHGGGFLQYLDGKTGATHIIASSLTPKKREEFRRYRIVKPAWVVESIKAGRMLPWDAFRVVDEGQSQKVLRFDNGRILSQTNAQKTGYRDQTSSSWYTSQLQSAGQSDQPLEQLYKNVEAPDALYKDDHLSSMNTRSDYGEFPSFDASDPAVKEALPITFPEKDTANDMSPIKNTIHHDERSLSSDPQVDTALTTSPSLEHVPLKVNMTSEEYNAQLLSDPRMKKSSVINPEFIQQYYKESRLHHLSTWKADLKAQLQSATREKSQSQTRRRNPNPGARRYILHVDFDSFFAAVSILKHPELTEKPVAIAHGPGNGSEIASCNYPARAHGVKNGMWMKGALQACPDLKVLPYDFPAYEDASRKFYSSVLSIDGIVQSVSIDEALIDVTTQCLEAGGTDGKVISEGSIYREQAKADEIAQTLRDSVKAKTSCAVSVGIGGNILLAKVALRKAKPAGQFQLKPEAVLDFIGDLTVQDLPGIGYSLGAKLEEIGAKFVKDIRDLSRERLLSHLGPKTGAKVWDYARGIDRTEVGNEVIRKSVSAEVNWGIRFVSQDQAEDFVRSLCEELHRRLIEHLVKGKQLTLKVMKRSSDAPLESVKHLGHGKCDVFNKSVILGVASNAKEVLGKEAVSMLRGFGISPGDLRGLGVQMTKLEPVKSGASAEEPESSQKKLNFQASPVRNRIEQPVDPDELDSPRKEESASVSRALSLNDSNHKPLNLTGTQFILPSQADPRVVAELPGDIRSKLLSQAKPRQSSRSQSPCPPAHTRRVAAAELPPQSQLDADTLAALPDDVRAEVLGYYDQSSREPAPELSTSAPPPQPPSRPSSSGSLRLKLPTTPTKKRRGRPSTKAVGNMKLSSFGLTRTVNPSTSTTAPSLPRQPQPSLPTEQQSEVSAEFLAALPEDIRREVLEEQKRSQTQRLNPFAPSNRMTAQNRQPSVPAAAPPQPQPQKRLQLPPLPERPTFTSQRLSSLPELRDAIGSWYSAFQTDGPFQEDVASLARYLKRVVLEEKDVDKAISALGWLIWLVDDGRSNTQLPDGQSASSIPSGSPQGAITWDETLESLKDGVRDGVEERGLPPVEFD